jgi:hypothetical protein
MKITASIESVYLSEAVYVMMSYGKIFSNISVKNIRTDRDHLEISLWGTCLVDYIRMFLHELI